MEANEHSYRKQIGKTLTDPHGLGLKEAVGEYTGQKLGPTYFRGFARYNSGGRLCDAGWIWCRS
jgi:hypothetical protein